MDRGVEQGLTWEEIKCISLSAVEKKRKNRQLAIWEIMSSPYMFSSRPPYAIVHHTNAMQGRDHMFQDPQEYQHMSRRQFMN